MSDSGMTLRYWLLLFAAILAADVVSQAVFEFYIKPRHLAAERNGTALGGMQ